MKPKFYCTNCMRYLNRLQVSKEEDLTLSPVYFCKWCSEAVIQLKKVKRAMLSDYIEYLIVNNKENDYE